MKESPEIEKLEQVLRSSKLVAGGFMGTDSRSIFEIIDSDAKKLEKLFLNSKKLADRMEKITEIAKPKLGNWVKIDENIKAKSEDFKGYLVCPWPHAGRIEKRITTATNINNGKYARWTDLNIHLIREHGFFEGKGSQFRIEPEEIVQVIF
jgi:hypothetical protein